MSIKVTSRVWEHSRQRNSRLLLLLALADFAHDSGVCWEQGLTLDTIARKARVNERQGRNLLAQIAAEGELFAPPVAGRGHTNRYFVVAGLDAAAIAATLLREFGYDQPTAQQLAKDLLQRQQTAVDETGEGTEVGNESAFAGEPASQPATPSVRRASQGRSVKKGQSGAPLYAQKRGNRAAEKGQSGAEKGQSGAEKGQSGAEKGQSGSGKGAIRRTPRAAERAAGRPKAPLASGDPMIPPDPSHDPPSPVPTRTTRTAEEEVTPTEALLLTTGLYPSTARALRDLPFDAVQAYVQRRQQQGWNAGAIKQGLEREQDQLCGRTPATPSALTTDWQSAARALCPQGSAADDVAWVAALLRDGSPPREAQALLTRRIARRTLSPGGRYVAV